MSFLEEYLEQGYKLLENNDPSSKVFHLVKMVEKQNKKYVEEVVVSGEMELYRSTHNCSDIYKFYKIFNLLKYPILNEIYSIPKDTLIGAFSSYCFEEQQLRCCKCIDKGGVTLTKDKMCAYCIRNNFAICGDGKRDFCSTNPEERQKIMEEYEQSKRDKYQKKNV